VNLRRRITAAAKRLRGDRRHLKVARRLHKHFREEAEREEKGLLAAQKRGDQGAADRHERRRLRAHHKALYWKREIRETQRKIKHLSKLEHELEADLRKLEKHVHFEGENKVRGGTIPQRLKAAQARAMLNFRKREQPGYYSMSGAVRDYLHALWHYALGRIWDCSTYVDGTYVVCGLTPPSGPHTLTEGGWTETQLAHGRRVREAEARDGDLVIYLKSPGDREGHHVEEIYDHSRKLTSGHGDEAINLANGGDYDLFGDGLYEIRTYH
jgi:hypothetical protein